MEDKNQLPAEGELTSSKKKRRGEDVFTSWLRRRNLPLEPDTATAAKEEAPEVQEPKKPSLYERFNMAFKNPFRRQVEVAYASPLEDEPKRESFKPAPADWFEANTEENPTQILEAKDNLPEVNTTTSEGPEGLLLVSADEHQRQELKESIENRSRFANVGEANAASEPKPKKEVVEKTKVVNESIDHPIKPTNELALSTGEILRRQRERHLKRQVEKLKEQAKSTSKEQAEMIKNQQEFQRQLDERAKREAEIANQRLPKLERAVQTPAETKAAKANVQGEIDLTKNVEYTPVPLGQEAVLPKVPELQPDKLKEMVSAPPPERPEVILNTVEKAAEKNVAIESLYERRHEIKDEPKIAAQASYAAIGGAAASKQRQHGLNYQPPPAMAAAGQPQPLMPRSPQGTSPQNLYKQAALSGAGTALLICLLLIIWILLS
jgi:hypothetical protein